MLDLKSTPKTVTTDNFMYDLFEGGWVIPEDHLSPESAQKVRESMFCNFVLPKTT